MSPPIRIIATDFDGTLYAEFETPPVPVDLQMRIGQLQQQGAKWVINTGRDLSALLETLGRARLSIRPDYLVVVEREIYAHEKSRYVGLESWNRACTRAHEELFARVREDIGRLMAWVNARFDAMVYEDAYSPFCLIADNNGDADSIYEYLNEYCRNVENLTVVRNDVYARLSHAHYSKGSALSEISRLLGIDAEHILVAGDHFNDLSMLTRERARWLVAPSNAIEPVKTAIRDQGGFISSEPHGCGVLQGIDHILARFHDHRIGRPT